jgi:hypothetical protein
MLLVFSGASIKAQNLPCSTFENPNPGGNWTTSFCSVTYANNDSWDGSQCAKLHDKSGPSWFTNKKDFNSLGKLYPDRCLCFDYYLVNDGDPNASNPINPTIYISNGINTIAFVANVTVYEGTTGWVHVCAPIEHCTSSTLPGNADGNWVMSATMTCTDFNNVLDGANSIGFPTDFTSYQTEEMWIDNICVKECPKPCQSDFEFKPVFNTATGFVYADVFLLATDPNSYYTVDWGDSYVTGLYVSHVYASPGTYVVCVTQYDKQTKKPICRTCFKFCYGEATHEYSNIDGGGIEIGAGRAGKSVGTNIKSMLNTTYYEEGFGLFPNPAQDYVQVELPGNENAKTQIRIFDIFGKIVSETNVSAGESNRNVKISTEKLSTGIYTVEITIGDIVTSQKLSVTK